MQGQRLARVARDGLEQGSLVAALRHAEVDGGPAHADSQSVTASASCGQRGHQDLAGHRLTAVAAVQLQQELLDEATQVDVLDLLDDEAALTTDPAAADVEDLDGGLELVLGEADDVGVGGVAEHDRVLLHRLRRAPTSSRSRAARS